MSKRKTGTFCFYIMTSPSFTFIISSQWSSLSKPVTPPASLPQQHSAARLHGCGEAQQGSFWYMALRTVAPGLNWRMEAPLSLRWLSREKTNPNHTAFVLLKTLRPVKHAQHIPDPQSKCSTNIVDWLIDQVSSLPAHVQRFSLKALLLSENICLRKPCFKGESHREETAAQQAANGRHDSKMTRGLENPISLLFSNFTFLKMNHWCGKRTLTLNSPTAPPGGGMWDLPKHVAVGVSHSMVCDFHCLPFLVTSWGLWSLILPVCPSVFQILVVT